jgi:VanZ family protein
MIFLESTATMSAANTSEWLYPLWVRLFGSISPAHWAEVHHLIRKTGHFVGYGLVSIAFFYGWRQSLHRMAVKHWTLWRRASVLAVVCTLVIAILDELHQSYLPSRTSSPIDVCIDLSGAIAAQLLLLLLIQLFTRRPGLRAA